MHIPTARSYDEEVHIQALLNALDRTCLPEANNAGVNNCCNELQFVLLEKFRRFLFLNLNIACDACVRIYNINPSQDYCKCTLGMERST